MAMFYLLLLLVLVGIVSFVLGPIKVLRNIIAFLGAVTAFFYFLTNIKPGLIYSLNIRVYNVHFEAGFSSMFFGVIITALFIIFLIASFHEENDGAYYLFAYLTLTGALAVLFAKDLISFFFFFETMSLFSFLMVLKGKSDTSFRSAFKYLVWSVFGGYAFLMGTFLKVYYTHSVMIGNISYLAGGVKLLILILLLTPFAVKAALMPFHLWAPDAYKDSKDTFTVFFSGGLSKIGVFGYFLVLFKVFTEIAVKYPYFLKAFAWLGAITAALSGIYAFMQDDAKKLLAYSSISQLGYVAVGFGIYTHFSVVAALFHALGHAVFESLLFLVVAGVYYRTKTTDLRKMGGLIKRMPLSFIGLLFGIIATSGIPPTIGFPSKWLLYEALILKGDLLLTSLVFFASITAFLYSYKLVHGIFLGKLHEEHKNVKEAPLGYAFGTVVLLVPLLVLGIIPGLVIKPIDYIVRFYLKPELGYNLANMNTPLGHVNFPVVGLVMGLTFALSLFIYLIAGKSYRAEQTDNYTATEAIDEDFELHYAGEFYGFMKKAFGRPLTWSFEKILNAFLKLFSFLGEIARGFYMGDARVYLFYVIAFFALLAYLMGGKL